jgi:RNase P/RNase MRP subunit POP5
MKIKSSLKPLPKSMRERKRYILFKTSFIKSKKDLFDLIQFRFLNEFDSIGLAKSDLRLIFLNKEFGLLRVNFAWIDKTKKLLSELNIGYEFISLHGTIKSAKKGF